MKLAIVFDNRSRPETTGFYCRRALARQTDIEHLLPEELQAIPSGLFDWYLFVDDGLDYPIPDYLRPRAAWLIDTHLRFDRLLERFGHAELLFAAQRDGAIKLAEALQSDVQWLPLACDPDMHRPVACDQRFEIAFIGNLVGQQRVSLLDSLRQRYPRVRIEQAYFDDMAAAYCSARVGFNCSVENDINMRVFEIPACGLPLITNEIPYNGLEELFARGQELLTYSSREELFSCVERLLEDGNLLQSIATAGRRRVLRDHTYAQRMTRLLAAMNSFSGQTVVATKWREVPKPAPYFEHERPDLLEIIPETAGRVLDVGCGGGRLGQALRWRQSAHVTGIEPVVMAARHAKQRLDRLVESRIEDIPANAFERREFDCMIFADVLEHLRDPSTILKRCREWLADEGSVVISIPNSRHHSVVSGLLQGNWTYESAGLLDEDHVRCFTRREIEKLLFRCGFQVEQVRVVPGSGYSEWRDSDTRGRVMIGGLCIEGIPAEEAEEFYVYQYLLVASKRCMPRYGLTSIIIPTHNQVHYTKECVDSIQLRTGPNYELIFVDNGSTDGTVELLETIPNSRLVKNDANLGFARAVNQGLEIARGEYCLLLNNDTVASTGWLEGLLEVLTADTSTALVGPVTNNVSGCQQIPVSYTEISSMDGFAWDLRKHPRTQSCDRIVGFCMLFRRSLIDEIGKLDTRFEIGCFEDDDFCVRVARAGKRIVVATHVFIHHYGGATFRSLDTDFASIMESNRKRFEDKWYCGNSDSVASTSAGDLAYATVDTPDGQQLLKRRYPRISLCMIVRDNEDTIEDCLDSVFPWVDEIIIVDTGSRDRTIEICEQFGARVYHFPWCDDFSAARNESLKHAWGEWIFWMDSDDVLPEPQGERLRQLALGRHADNCLGYVVQVQCPSGVNGEMTVVDHVKLIRNRQDLRFEHRIHEQILPAIRRAGGEVAFTDIYVVHRGAIQSSEVRQRKIDRDFRILALDLQERPNHPFVLFNLGMTHENVGQFAEAEDYLRQCIEVSAAADSHVGKAWVLLASSVHAQGRLDEAVDICSRGIEQSPANAELIFRRAMVFHDLNHLEQAAQDYQAIERLSIGRTSYRSLDPGICSYKCFHNLGVVLEALGQQEEAHRYWMRAIETQPAFSGAWLAHARSLSRLKQSDRLHRLQELAAKTSALDDATVNIIYALNLEEQRRPHQAIDALLAAWRASGEHQCLEEACRMAFEAGLFDQARPLLEELTEIRPDDPAVLHNLGFCWRMLGNADEAERNLQRSFKLRPVSPSTAIELSNLLKEHGQVEDAIDVLRTAERYHPTHHDLLSALDELRMFPKSAPT